MNDETNKTGAATETAGSDSKRLVIPEHSIEGELLKREPGYFTVGDYVSRDGTDIHYVVELDSDLITVVCIIAPADKWVKPGELEDNLTRRYNLIDKTLIPKAKKAHEMLKLRFPDGWKY